MDPDRKIYLQSLTHLYLCLPDTPRRLSRFDHHLAHHLFDRRIPLALVETAFLLASARRATRPQASPPLAPIRSLHYFLPVIEELLENPLPYSYLTYLRRKVPLRPSP
jgi:hypothetical protein